MDWVGTEFRKKVFKYMFFIGFLIHFLLKKCKFNCVV